MKEYDKYFWHVDKFNTEGKDKVPFKPLDDGSFKVLFPHKRFEHNLRQLFEKEIEIRNKDGERFNISFNQNGSLIEELDPKKIIGFKYVDDEVEKEYSADLFKTIWGKKGKNQLWYNEVTVTPKDCEKDPVDFELQDMKDKYLKSQNCRYCGIKTIAPPSFVNKKNLEEFNNLFETDFGLVKEMKEYLRKASLKPSRVVNFDHKYEKSLGGNNNPSNMSLVCKECHNSKSGALKLITGSPELYGFFINKSFKEEAPEITDHMMLKKFGKRYDPKILELKINQC